MSISAELEALDKIIAGSIGLADEAVARKADLKQGKLASELWGRTNTALKGKLDYRLQQQKLIEIEAKLIEHQNVLAAPKRAKKRAA